MKNTIRLFLAAVLVAGAAWGGETITAEQAKTVAANFVAKDSVGQSVLPGRTVGAVAARGSLWLVTLQPSGYLLVGGNRSAEPIYTFSAVDFAEPEADSPQEAILARLAKLAAEASGTDNETRWQKLLGEKAATTVRRAAFASSTTEAVNIAPLVESNWGQTYPFNGLSPVIKKSHTPVGCVATAYDQILRYWEWPEVLDADIVTEHFVDNAWGLKWQLLAGTDFEWASAPLDAKTFDNPTSLRMSRQAIFAGMIAKMDYNTQSGAQTGQPGVNRWYTPYTCLDDSNSTLEKRTEEMIASLQAGCPFMVSVTYSGMGHAVVGDGWMTSSVDGSSWVHMNYGWQSTDTTTYYTPSSAEGVYLYQKPRPMVLNRPLGTHSTLPVALKWAFPTKGYENSLKDFVIGYTEVSESVTDWSDDLSEPKGTLDGTLITTATVDGWNGGDVLKVGTQADESYYTWPTVVATEATKLTYDVHSNNARGMFVQVQLFDPTTGWTTIDTPTLGESSERDWETRTVNLAAYAGKGIAVRIYATRPSSKASYVISDTAGVHFDNVKLTQVREAGSTAVGTTVVDGALRTAAISDDVLAKGRTYLFTVTPRFNDDTIVGIPGHAQSCTIVEESVAQPVFISVSSVTSNAPKFGTDGMQRNAYLGLNQIGVYGSAAMTSLTAELNVKSIVDWVEEEDAAFPGTYITAAKAVSIADAAQVEKKSDGNFLVRVDLSGLTENVLYTETILTLRGYNDVGDVCQKDIVLYFNKIDNETSIDIKDLPENGGTVVIPDPDPVTPDPVTPDPEGTDPEEPDPEEPNEPEEPEEEEETPVVTPTFPVAAGAGPNDNATDKTRFCPGVTATKGAYDVTRTGSYNRHIPVAYNLLYWLVDRYNTVLSRSIDKPTTGSLPSNEGSYTIASYATKLLDDTYTSTLRSEIGQYFPSAEYTAESWHGTGDESSWAKTTGKAIYAALANGPIACSVRTSTSYSCAATIWGCEYAEDGEEKYATALYVTDTISSTQNNDATTKFTFAVYTTRDGYYKQPGLMNFNGTGNHGVIEDFYPISGPEPESSGEGEVTVSVSAGGNTYDISKAFSKVEKSSGGAVTYTLDATPGKKLAIAKADGTTEDISIKPELADGEDETPFAVQEGKLVFTVKSIPGLKYQVMACDTPSGTFEPAGQSREAIGTRRELTVTRSGETRGFYKIQVSR